MIEESVPQTHGPENPEPVGCFRHEGGEAGEGYPRCDGSGYRPRAYCAECGEAAGSISAGTGAPLVGEKGGLFYHVNCRPGAGAGAEIGLAMLEGMGG